MGWEAPEHKDHAMYRWQKLYDRQRFQPWLWLIFLHMSHPVKAVNFDNLCTQLVEMIISTDRYIPTHLSLRHWCLVLRLKGLLFQHSHTDIHKDLPTPQSVIIKPAVRHMASCQVSHCQSIGLATTCLNSSYSSSLRAVWSQPTVSTFGDCPPVWLTDCCKGCLRTVLRHVNLRPLCLAPSYATKNTVEGQLVSNYPS